MFQTFKNAWKIPDLRKKLLFTVLAIVLYRLGACIPVPWVTSAFADSLSQAGTNAAFTYLNIMSGDAFGKATLFALSVSPYITASIVVQLLTIAIPPLERLAKEGEAGKKKISMITRIITVVLSLVTAIGYARLLRVQYGALSVSVDSNKNLTGEGWFQMIVIIACFCAGAALIMWIAERIDEFGIGNGISIILFANIVARIPSQIQELITVALKKPSNENASMSAQTAVWTDNPVHIVLGILGILLFLAVVVAVFYFVIWFTNSERRIPIQYAKRTVGRKMYGGQSSNLPLKMNMAGVMPIIFAGSIVNIPSMLGGIFSGKFWTNVTNAFNQTHASYIIISGVLLVAFSYFYIMISFNPVEVANNIKNNGGAIPGIRPGRPTIDFIKKVLNRVTFIGAVFLCLVSTLPMVANAIYMLFANTTTPNIIEYTRNSLVSELAFAGSSLLIITGVVIETTRSLDAQMSLRNYKGFLD